MRPSDRTRAALIERKLQAFSETVCVMPGIENVESRKVLVEQLIESIRRIEYIAKIKDRGVDAVCADPTNDCFDPLKAAIHHFENQNIDEAFWLIFLATHFGKHLRHKWKLVRNVYGRLGQGDKWSWAMVSARPNDFVNWLAENAPQLRDHAQSGAFSSHRKYESLNPASRRSTGAVVTSYIGQIGANRGHRMFIQEAIDAVGNDPHALFDYLYNNTEILSFGRLGKFDFFTMLGKIGLAPLEPRSPYLKGATGPARGGRLLFGGDVDAKLSDSVVEAHITELGNFLGLNMQVMEDALCNWQKSPAHFIAFRG